MKTKTLRGGARLASIAPMAALGCALLLAAAPALANHTQSGKERAVPVSIEKSAGGNAHGQSNGSSKAPKGHATVASTHAPAPPAAAKATASAGSAIHGAAKPGAAMGGDGTTPHWAYEGTQGPDRWAVLADAFVACANGRNQSPIDIGTTYEGKGPVLRFDYQDVQLAIVNNGHTIQVNVPPGSTLTADGKLFQLLQFHFHLPSEHKVGGRAHEMEAHLVHRNEQGQLAVVGVLLSAGRENAFLKKLWGHLPTLEGEERRLSKLTINPQELLPRNRRAFVYAGSLTTPPCSEGVFWNVMSTPVEVSNAQVTAFRSVFKMNARPVQPLNNRPVVSQLAP